MRKPQLNLLLHALLLLMAVAITPQFAFAEKTDLGNAENKKAKIAEAATVNEPDRLFMMTAQHCASTQAGNSFFNTTTGSISLPALTVPSGDDRLLVVTVHSQMTVSTVTYGTMALTKKATQMTTFNGSKVMHTEIWVKPLGSGGDINILANEITINGTSPTADNISKTIVGSVTCFSGIDQTTPVGATGQNGGTGTDSSIPLSSISGDIVVDALSLDLTTMPTPGGGQNAIFDISIFTGDIGRAASSSKPATSTSTSVSWTFPNDEYAHVAIVLNQVGDLTATDTEDVGLSAVDPCSCDDPLNKTVGNDFLFHDVFTVRALSGRTVTISATDMEFLQADGTPFPVNTPVPEIGTTGVFQLEFFHKAGIASTIMYTDGFTTNTFVTSSCTICADPVPTMSQWGLLVFGLLILNLGLMFVYRLERKV